jgi:hypothetical protein
VASRLEEVLKERLLAGEAPGKPVAGMPQDFLRTEAQKKF